MRQSFFRALVQDLLKKKLREFLHQHRFEHLLTVCNDVVTIDKADKQVADVVYSLGCLLLCQLLHE